MNYLEQGYKNGLIYDHVHRCIHAYIYFNHFLIKACNCSGTFYHTQFSITLDCIQLVFICYLHVLSLLRDLPNIPAQQNPSTLSVIVQKPTLVQNYLYSESIWKWQAEADVCFSTRHWSFN